MAKPPLTVVTWNVNSLRSRMDRVLAWTDRHRPSVLCLQETKCSDDQFCAKEFEALGYHVCFAGETSGRNGVAIVADAPLEDVVSRLPGRDDDEQRRFLSARVHGLRVIDCYVPNGQAVGSEAFFYKLDWLARLQAHLVESHDPSEPLALVGDFNICPEARDV